MNAAKKPNLFIVGAPKCGTTAMAHYLSLHPDIFVPKLKEPHYFMRDDMPIKGALSYTDYISLYADAETHNYLVDASVWYLYGKKSIKNIFNYNPSSKIIAMLRNPCEMTQSMHQQSFIGRSEDIKNFEQAWFITDNRKRNQNIPKQCAEPSILYYDEIAKYGEQLERLYQYFDKDNVLVIFYDDFKNDTKKTHQTVLEFLSLQCILLSDYKVINKRKEVRSIFLRNITRRYPRSMVKLIRSVKSTFNINFSLNILPRLRKLNQKETKPPAISNKLRLAIINNYRNDIQKLEKLTGANLKTWLE